MQSDYRTNQAAEVYNKQAVIVSHAEAAHRLGLLEIRQIIEYILQFVDNFVVHGKLAAEHGGQVLADVQEAAMQAAQ